MRERRMAEPGAAEAYDVVRLDFERDHAVRELRERRGRSQTRLAKASETTPSAETGEVRRDDAATASAGSCDGE
jgi:hypothetical protein